MNNHFDERAKMLVGAARALAISSYTSFADEIPIIHSFRPQDWDFFVTVGSVFVAASALHQMNVGDLEDRLMDVVTEDCERWDSNASRGFEDCKELYEKTFDELASSEAYRRDRRFLSADSVGIWIAWNLLGHQPTSENEHKLVRLVGVAVTHAFADWWKP